VIDPAEKSDIESLRGEILALRAELQEALRIFQGDYVTIASIARDLGRSREWIRLRPWVLPNFGVPEMGRKPMKWKRATWERWKENLEEHRREWEKMTAFQREQTRKVS